MANNVPIGQLPAASQINDADMFALEQAGEAKKLLGSLLKQFVTGPIESLTVSSVTLAPGANPTVEKTGGGANPYNIKFGLPKANSIESIVKTNTTGNVDTYTITMSSGSTVTFTVTNGAGQTTVTDHGTPQQIVEIENLIYRAVRESMSDFYPSQHIENNPENSVFPISVTDAIIAPIKSAVVKGKTVARNQLVQNGNFEDGTTGWSKNSSASISASNNILTLTTLAASASHRIWRAINCVATHTFFVQATVRPSAQYNIAVGIGSSDATISFGKTETVAANTWATISVIGSSENVGNVIVRFTGATIDAGVTLDVKEVNVIDLTAEGYTASETTDVATFKAAFLKKNGYPLPLYIPYDAGSLANVDGEYRIHSKNLLDEANADWVNGKILTANGTPNTESRYRYSNAYFNIVGGKEVTVSLNADANAWVSMCFYDANKNFLERINVASAGVSSGTITPPIAACFYRINVGMNASNIQVELGATATAYEPYYNGGTAGCINLWDEVWEIGSISASDGSNYSANDQIRSKNYIPVENETHYIKSPTAVVLHFYDKERNYIGNTSQNGNATFSTPNGTRFVRFRTAVAYGTTYNYDICINRSDSLINGKYFPYVKPLNGIGTVQDEKDLVTGKRTTRYGMADLGSLTWSHKTTIVSGVTYHYFQNNAVTDIKQVSAASEIANIICAKYRTSSQSQWVANSPCITLTTTGYIIIGDDNYTDSATLKAALSGVYLIYELATPIEEYEPAQPLTTKDGYNILEPINGAIQSAEVAVDYFSYAEPVRVSEQIFTDTQKEQARANIAAAKVVTKKAYNATDQLKFDIVLRDAEHMPLQSSVIKGKTEVVNQLVQEPVPTGTYIGLTVTNNGDGSITINGTPTSSVSSIVPSNKFSPTVVGHVLYIFGGDSVVRLRGYTSRVYSDCDSGNGIIIIAESVNDPRLAIVLPNTSTPISNVKIYPQCLDLSLYFNPSELTAIGTDVAKLKTAWLNKFGYPLPKYIPFTSGSLANVNGKYHIRKRNLWDEKYEHGSYGANGNPTPSTTNWRTVNPIPVIDSLMYFINSSAWQTIKCYDANDNFIDNAAYGSASGGYRLTFPNGTRYIRIAFTSTEPVNTCVIVSDTAINGQYFPYYDGRVIDCSNKPLNGIGTVYDEKDFATGERVTRFGMVDLGTLTWYYDSNWGVMKSTGITNAKSVPQNQFGNIINSAGYTTVTKMTATEADKTIVLNSQAHAVNTLFIKDTAYTDPAAFKTAMSGVYLCYELATPVITTEEPQPLIPSEEYAVLEPISGDIQSAEVSIEYGVQSNKVVNEIDDKILNILDALPNVNVAGPVASFPDGAKDIPIKSLIASIAPVQDLHGYDNPWPAGSGKNKWGNGDVSKTASNIYDSITLVESLPAGTYTISLSATSDSGIVRLSFRFPTSVNVDLVADGTRKSATFTLPDTCTLVYFYGQNSASSRNAASINDVQIESGSTATSFVPYSNICPISGRTGCKIIHESENLLSPMTLGVYYNATGAKIVSSSTEYAATEKIAIPTGNLHFKNFSESITRGSLVYLMWDENETYLGKVNIVYDFVKNTDYIITPVSGCKYIAIMAYRANTYNGATEYTQAQTSLTISTASIYTGYKAPTLYLVAFPSSAGTVYGGYLDVTNGKLVVNMAIDDIPSMTWYKNTTWGMYGVPSQTPVWFSQGQIGNAICSAYKTGRGLGAPDTRTFCMYQSYMRVGDMRFDDVDAFKTAMAGQTVCYEIANPITYDLTPIEIETLLGYNNIFADTGDVDVTYRADVAKYIQKLLEA